MEDQFILVPSSWQDWITVWGFVSLTCFVIWRILVSK